jgi:hypothetical protein
LSLLGTYQKESFLIDSIVLKSLFKETKGVYKLPVAYYKGNTEKYAINGDRCYLYVYIDINKKLNYSRLYFFVNYPSMHIKAESKMKKADDFMKDFINTQKGKKYSEATYTEYLDFVSKFL